MQVLVLCCGSNKCVWVRLHEALPFERHRHEKVSEAQALIDHKKLPQAAAFHRAVKARGPHSYHRCTAGCHVP